jgi:hypothetical protein
MLKYIGYINNSERNLFTKEVNNVAAYIGVEADWLMTIFYKESRVNPQAVNSQSGATGLIQFLPSTANRLGTSTTQLRTMTAQQQLYYVKKYFDPYKGKLNNVYDTYFAVFYPKAIGKADGTILFSTGSTAYAQNKSLDQDKNGNVTVLDVKKWFAKGADLKISTQSKYITGVGVIIAIIAYYIYKKWTGFKF